MSNSLKITPQDPDCVRIVQLTDPHLFAEPERQLLGINTRDSLSAVLAKLAAETTSFDLLVVSGDVSQDHSVASYRVFVEMTKSLGIPMVWLPGNHDIADVMAEGMQGEHVFAERIIDCGPWRLVLGESHVPGHTHGQVSDQQQTFIADALNARDDAYQLIFTHHHPLPVGCAWLDQHSLRNGMELLTLLGQFPLCRGLVWGHVHQDLSTQYGDIRLLATPSTCVQFLPKSDQFALDEAQPGYRILQLHGDGRMTTTVQRVAAGSFIADADACGY